MKYLNYATKILSITLCIAISFSLLGIGAYAKTTCPEIEGNNIGENKYTMYWSSVINSYLHKTDKGFVRFQGDAIDGKYLVEYYDFNYKLQKNVLVSEELPIFGGFYANGNNFYVLSGQNNMDELDSVECFRITKYDLNWKRLTSVGLRDCNTYIPFDAGTARFAECGKYLFIRTSHEMYADENGRNHQANVTIQLDTEEMKITDSLCEVSNRKAGYVSHSFNQFIKIENNKIVALDHGDAMPRSIVLTKYPTDVSNGSFFTWECENINALEFPGQIGKNQTGTELGGFEISNNSYLIAYSAVDLDENFEQYNTKNVYTISVDKNTSAITKNKITNFFEGEEGAGVPHLVKISENEFLLMWAQGDDVYYTKTDGNGKVIGKTYCFDGAYLSDCAPVTANGKIVWYIYNNEITTFYDINIENLSVTSKTEVYSGHDTKVLSYPEKAGGNCTTVCEKCGQTDTFKTSASMMIYWNTEDCLGVYNWPLKETDFNVGDKLYIMIGDEDEDSTHNDKIIKFSDNSAITYTKTNENMGYFTVLKPGKHTITVSYKYSPIVAETFTLNISGGGNTGGTVGDVNMNGEIDSMDYILLKRAYFGTYALNSEQTVRGDINQNGEIDSMDYILLKRAYFGTYTI